jgi:adenosylhomocysteine nucleosidase
MNTKTYGLSKFKWINTLFYLIVVMAMTVYAEQPYIPVTAIIGAFDEEVRLIQQEMENRKVETYLGVKFSIGNLRGRSVVLAYTGIGKVNASMTTTLLLDHFQPKEVFFTGIAGSLNPKLSPGDIIIGERLIQHDLGQYTSEGFMPDGVRSPVDGAKNPVIFFSDPDLVKIVKEGSQITSFAPITQDSVRRKPSVVTGTIVTGDAFISSQTKRLELQEQFRADAVEMEGAAVAQVCHQAGTPFIVVRCISDKADEFAKRDLNRFYKIAAQNSANLILKVVELLVERDNTNTHESGSQTNVKSNIKR